MSDEQNSPEMPEVAEGPGAAEFAVLEALRAEIEVLKDQRLRAMAETENLRRRADKEKKESETYAITKFARDMLGIADNFSRALAACPPAAREAADPQIKAVLDGVEATDRQLLASLERYGVKPISTEDGKFDPNFHQAVAEVPGNGKPAGSIVDVMQTGFMIGDRLLRPAMVTVARRGETTPPSSTATGEAVDTKA
jgi:molecular chaperone GrpE